MQVRGFHHPRQGIAQSGFTLGNPSDHALRGGQRKLSKLETGLSDTDSFIEEVTEEVRRDKLYAIFRKYAWIPILVVVLIVGGAAYNEWRKASARSAAQGLGDNILTALSDADAAQRADGLAAITPANTDAGTFLAMLEAAARTESQDRDGALALLDSIAANAAAPDSYRQIAELKAVMLRGADQGREERLEILDLLSAPGNPFRVIALEQKALVLAEFGNNEASIAVLRMILEEPGATQGLLQRAQQLIVALGGALTDGEDTTDAGDNG